MTSIHSPIYGVVTLLHNFGLQGSLKVNNSDLRSGEARRCQGLSSVLLLFNRMVVGISTPHDQISSFSVFKGISTFEFLTEPCTCFFS
jgi:hypothetical protein